MAKKSDLLAAYCATTYRVLLPGAPCDLRIDQPSPLLRDWLLEHQVSAWAVITAHNPSSQRLAPGDNAERQASLVADLVAAGHAPIFASNIPDTAGWPVEDAVFIAGMSLVDACTFARDYGQNALVCGTGDGLPHLFWVNSGAR